MEEGRNEVIDVKMEEGSEEDEEASGTRELLQRGGSMGKDYCNSLDTMPLIASSVSFFIYSPTPSFPLHQLVLVNSISNPLLLPSSTIFPFSCSLQTFNFSMLLWHWPM